MIPREVIEEVSARNDIVDVISGYVTLKRAGSNFSGVCPFHSEKTPSFTVFPKTQSFYCFGCGAGGSAFTFIMKIENIEYMPAVEKLADRVGIRIDNSQSESPDGVSRRRILDINLTAAKFFRDCLYDENIGKAALKYLTVDRGLTKPVINHFGIGCAPDSFNALTNKLIASGYTEKEIETAFLGRKSQKTGKLYDLFRNRVMFPVFDTSGNVIAFSGRRINDSDERKYVNTTDTPAFKKSRNLFALNYAKNHVENGLILCEGQMDVIALHAAGFENAVAALGTAFGAEQARLMTKYTNKVTLALDSDAAGQKATAKIIGILKEVGLETRVIEISGAKDADEYIKKYGRDKFARLIGESKNEFDFKAEAIFSKYDINIPDDKIKAVGEICEVIANFHSNAEREVYIAAVSDKLKLPIDSIRNDVNRMRRQHERTSKAEEAKKLYTETRGFGDRINPDTVKSKNAVSAEEVIIGLLLIYEEHREAVISKRVELTSEDFFSDFNRRIFDKIMKLEGSDRGFSPALIGECFTADEMGRIQEIEQKRRVLSENGIAVLKSSIETLKSEKQRYELRTGDDAEADIMNLLERKRKKIQDNG